MRIQLLHVPDCPSVTPLLTLLDQLVGERPNVRVVPETIADEARAAALGMTGSPTLLVDGRDPFGRPDTRPSVGCRLYRDEHDQLARMPSLTQLRQALTAAEADDA